MFHEQLPFTWSTFRDSSMGINLKYFWKTHESVLHVIYTSWFLHGYKVEIFLKNKKSNWSWDMFLWKWSGGLHTFMSFSKIFQLFTHARITKCGSRERWLFVRHVFVNKLSRTSQFHEFFKNISTLYPC